MAKKTAGGLHSMRYKYFEILERQVVVPARDELFERQAMFQAELDKLDRSSADYQIVSRGLRQELLQTEMSLNGLEAGLEAIKTMRLQDLTKLTRFIASFRDQGM